MVISYTVHYIESVYQYYALYILEEGMVIYNMHVPT